jgi:hypothetical protein
MRTIWGLSLSFAKNAYRGAIGGRLTDLQGPAPGCGHRVGSRNCRCHDSSGRSISRNIMLNIVKLS